MRRISSSKRNALAIDMAVAISEPAILSRIPFDQIRIEHLLSRADDVHHVLALTPEQSAFWRETTQAPYVVCCGNVQRGESNGNQHNGNRYRKTYLPYLNCFPA
jgi:hypothetical protein